MSTNSNTDCFPADMDQHWPTIDVLKKLTEAAEILLHENDYDGHGWEIISHCVDRSKEIQEKYYCMKMIMMDMDGK